MGCVCDSAASVCTPSNAKPLRPQLLRQNSNSTCAQLPGLVPSTASNPFATASDIRTFRVATNARAPVNNLFALERQWQPYATGWDVRVVEVSYSAEADALRVFVSCFGRCGDADGDGDASCTSSTLTLSGGVDMPSMATSESFAVFFDLGGARLDDVSATGLDGIADFAVGYPGGFSDSTLSEVIGENCALFTFSCFGVYEFENSQDYHASRFYANECPIAPDAFALDFTQTVSTNEYS
jgi:hypothetical protein